MEKPDNRPEMPNVRKGLAQGLFGRAREVVIGLLFSQEGVELHGREIAKRAHLSAAAISEELQNLSRMGLVASRPMANIVLYRADPSHPLYPELRSIAVKTWGVRGRLAEIFAPVQGIRCAFIFGSVARGEDRATSDIDVLAIGDAGFDQVAVLAQEASEELARTVNVKLYRPDEWRRKAADRDNPFFADLLQGPKIFIRGDEGLLHELTEPGEPGPARRPRKAGAGPRRGARSSQDSAGSPRHGATRRRP
jgi:predicted nucleotidyltransferase